MTLTSRRTDQATVRKVHVDFGVTDQRGRAIGALVETAPRGQEGGRVMVGPLPREAWPAALHQGPEGALVGVFVGGCCLRGPGSSFRAKAHAHTHGPVKGWLCLRGPKNLADTGLLLHELAHVVAGTGHTNAWRAVLLQLGGTLDATRTLREYHKRTRQLKDRRRPHLGYQHAPDCPCRPQLGATG
jgi:hypothetical protein